MIIVTGATGFIGSCLVAKLNSLEKNKLILVDDFSSTKKNKNLSGKSFYSKIDRAEFINWFRQNNNLITEVYHIGARTDTSEFNIAIFDRLNLNYSKSLWKICAENKIPFIYASSAAVYGSSMDFKEQKKNEKPLNIYGYSKLLFDQYVRKLKLTNEQQVVGLRYFNVYGPREYHKGSMASVAYNFNEQIKLKNMANLFKGSHGYSDGEQQRDFIYVDDVCNVNLWFLANSHISGIYNLGTGKPTSFNEVAKAIISWHKKGTINYIDFPKDLEIAYQCYTSADLENFRNTGCDLEFKDINEGIHQYLDHLSE